MCTGWRRDCFSSLYIGILAATHGYGVGHAAVLCFSSLYIGILAATIYFPTLCMSYCCFSSLYIGILAATFHFHRQGRGWYCFSSLYIGILAATLATAPGSDPPCPFQFPLHRDPRCNLGRRCIKRTKAKVSVPFTSGSSLQPVCSPDRRFRIPHVVSVPFTSGSSLQHIQMSRSHPNPQFQFPLHRDPRCNVMDEYNRIFADLVSVPFTSGSSLQHAVNPYRIAHLPVSVPFTSGSSLQPLDRHPVAQQQRVSVPFTSGSSLQR